MGETLDLFSDSPGEAAIRVHLRRSARARRLSLKVSRLDGRVTLTLPPRVALSEVEPFLQAQRGWLRRALAKAHSTEIVDFGTILPVEGRARTLRPGDGRKVSVEGDTLWVPAQTSAVGTRVEGFLKALARDRLAAASDYYAAQVGRPFSKLTLRDTRSRWGSCTSAGGLMYSWRLILAPPAALTYVAAHEVAHLVHMDHSPRFWGLVDQISPGWKVQRDWLRVHGPALHRFQFRA